MKERELKYDYENIYKRHLAGESLLTISRDLNIPIQSIYAYFYRNNLKYNTNIQKRHLGYSVNDNYLDNIDTEDKTYFLGWMLSDGYIHKNYFSLKLKSDDKYIIEEMFGKFSNGYKLNIDKNSVGISISSEKLINNLKNLGCINNKTKFGFGLPNININLFRHFLRGYFDGDGSIGKRSARPNQMQISICSIDNTFLEELKTKLLEFNINSEIYREIRKGKLLKRPNGVDNYSTDNIDMCRLVINSHKEKLKFYEFLYNNSTIKLFRKYNLYTKYYNNIFSLLKTKNSKIVEETDGNIINYELITDRTFKLGNEVDEKLILKLYKQGRNEFNIHKETKIGRSVINRIIKENIYETI